MDTIESLIDNADSYYLWQKNIATSKTLKQLNETESYIRYTTDLPWPITDREAVVHTVKTINSEGTVLFNITGATTYLPKNTDFIRIERIIGKWELKPLESGKIEVTYQFKGDPAGAIPKWLINLLIVDGPYETLINLRKLVS